MIQLIVFITLINNISIHQIDYYKNNNAFIMDETELYDYINNTSDVYIENIVYDCINKNRYLISKVMYDNIQISKNGKLSNIFIVMYKKYENELYPYFVHFLCQEDFKKLCIDEDNPKYWKKSMNSICVYKLLKTKFVYIDDLIRNEDSKWGEHFIRFASEPW